MLGNESGPPGQALEQDAAERKDVGAAVDGMLVVHLLGRQVARRPEHDARGGRGRGGLHEPSCAEVEHLDPRRIAGNEKEIARLHVAVHHAASMGDRQRPGDGPGEPQGLRDRQRPQGELLRQIVAVEPLHGDVRLASVRVSVIDVPDDMRMGHLGERPRLAQKSLRAPVRQHLQRDPLVGLRITSAIHQAHRPGPRVSLHMKSPRDDVARPHPSRDIARFRALSNRTTLEMRSGVA